MTLGDLIKILKEFPDKKKTVPVGLGDPHSYRGYYDQLAFEPAENITVEEMLEKAESALESTFEGYKGGEFLMEEHTKVYIACWGKTGESIGEILINYMLDRYR